MNKNTKKGTKMDPSRCSGSKGSYVRDSVNDAHQALINFSKNGGQINT